MASSNIAHKGYLLDDTHSRYTFNLITEENINTATRERFSEKTIVAFTSSTVFILLYI